MKPPVHGNIQAVQNAHKHEICVDMISQMSLTLPFPGKSNMNSDRFGEFTRVVVDAGV
jgi:hypothetical protein